MKETIIHEIVDNYLEHKHHILYDEHCSTCFSNVKEFDEPYDDGQGRKYDIIDEELE